MIKFNTGFSKERNAYLIGLGLTAENLKKLLQAKPIKIVGSEIGFETDDLNICLFGAKDENGIKRCLQEIAGHLQMPEDSKVTCLRIANRLYVFPINKNEKMYYFVGLEENGVKDLKNRQTLTFRAVVTEGKGLSVELIIFFIESEEIMEEKLIAAGLVNKNTTIRKDHENKNR